MNCILRRTCWYSVSRFLREDFYHEARNNKGNPSYFQACEAVIHAAQDAFDKYVQSQETDQETEEAPA